MRQKPERGSSAIEFAFSLLVLIPLLLGTVGLGLSMLREMQTVQLARDAGSMYARKTKFEVSGNQQVLASIAGSLSLTAGSGTAGTAGAGGAQVILSTIQYVNAALCAQASPTLAGTKPPCTNLGSWVFSKRLVVGNSSIFSSTLGAPDSSVTIGTDGSISINDQCLRPGDLVTGSIPWTSSTIAADAQAAVQTQPIYVSEAAALGFRLPPFSSGTITYSQLYF